MIIIPVPIATSNEQLPDWAAYLIGGLWIAVCLFGLYLCLKMAVDG